MAKLNYLLCAVMCCCVHLVEAQKSAPDWSKDATIYELNVRQFSPEGTFEAILPHLDRIQKMGIEIIWLMPIHPIGVKERKGGLGSYYAVKDYKAVNPEFGDDDSFKKLIDEVHKRDMKLIIDWVANHTSPDNVWVEAGNLDWYNLDSTGNVQPPPGTDWYDVSDLNYENQDMRAAMIDAMEYWVRDFDIDGYRCDVAGWVPTDFWDDARAALDKIKPVFMLAEAEGAELHVNAFDMTYGWEFHHIMNEVAKGHQNADSIVSYFKREYEKYEESAYRMQFTSNHDENSWNGTVFERMGDGVLTFAVLAATVQGMPLVYNGQEASLDKRLLFFEKDTIDWTSMDKESFYTTLLLLNKNNEALWNGTHGSKPKFVATGNPDVLAYYRQNGKDIVWAILNLSEEVQKVDFELPLNLQGKTLSDAFTKQDVKFGNTLCVELKPWQFHLNHK